MNVATNTQYWMWTDPDTGIIRTQMDANYSKFEANLEHLKNLHKRQGLSNVEEKKLNIEHRRKHQYFVSYRRFENDWGTNTVSIYCSNSLV